MIQILIGGDICPRGADLQSFEQGDTVGIFHDLLDDFKAADLVIVNLECPLTDVNSPISKCGPALRASAACIAGFKDTGISVFNMANNHILDHGSQGLESTLQVVRDAGFATLGAGQNIEEARKILVQPIGGIRIGILGVAEHEFSIATDTAPGANPLDLIDIVRNITTHRAEWDYLIVLVHGGNEGYPYPSPRLMDTCRFLVEQGANAVICQHSHCVGCYEDYCGGHIVYGQGNLVFNWPDPPPGFTEGVVVRLCIAVSGKSKMELLPCFQSHRQTGVTKMKPAAAQALIKTIAERSRSIQDATFVKTQWQQFCNTKEQAYLSAVLGHGPLFQRLNKHGTVGRYLYSEKTLRRTHNIIRCEAHHEILNTIFEKVLHKR